MEIVFGIWDCFLIVENKKEKEKRKRTKKGLKKRERTMVYQDRQPLYFYDVTVHAVFVSLISITLINIFVRALNNNIRSIKSSITLKLIFKMLKKSKYLP